jgi:hypothetical protein
MIRTEIRHSFERLALILDLRDISLHLSPGLEDNSNPLPRTRASVSENRMHILTAEWGRIVVAISQPKHDFAPAFLSIGPLATNPLALHAYAARPTRLVLGSADTGKSAAATTVVVLDIPSVYASVSKPTFDSLQTWVDGVSKLAEHAFTPVGDPPPNKDPNMIGNKFFLDSHYASPDSTTDKSAPRSPVGGQTVVEVVVTEGKHRFLLAREYRPTSNSLCTN